MISSITAHGTGRRRLDSASFRPRGKRKQRHSDQDSVAMRCARERPRIGKVKALEALHEGVVWSIGRRWRSRGVLERCWSGAVQ